MRVLIVTQYFWPESFRINDLALGLKDRGHKVTVFTGMPNYPGGRLFPGYGAFSPSRETFNDIPVLRVPLLPRGNGRLRLALNYASFALSSVLLGPLRCRGDFDLIFVYEPSPITIGLPALVLRRTKRAPVMFWVLDLWPESLAATGMAPSPFVAKAMTRLVRFIYAHCDRVLVQSEGFVEKVQAVGAAPDRVLYFPNWAEELYRPVEVEPGATERAEMPPGFLVMFAGNIGAAQSFETIFAAAERLRARPDIHWVILGEGHRRAWMQDEIRARGLSGTVHYLGSRPLETMPRYFALADALLVTLRRDPIFALTIPGRLQSYLACARPVLAALDGEGARVVREAGVGMAVPAEDAVGLAEAVLALHERGPDARAAMGRSGRRYFEEHFERGKLLDRLEAWMTDLQREWACAS